MIIYDGNSSYDSTSSYDEMPSYDGTWSYDGTSSYMIGSYDGIPSHDHIIDHMMKYHHMKLIFPFYKILKVEKGFWLLPILESSQHNIGLKCSSLGTVTIVRAQCRPRLSSDRPSEGGRRVGQTQTSLSQNLIHKKSQYLHLPSFIGKQAIVTHSAQNLKYREVHGRIWVKLCQIMYDWQ